MWYKKLHNQIFIGILAGIIFGFLLPSISVDISFIGNLFVEALKMIIAPLILSSIFVGISGLGDIRKLGSIGKQTIIYFTVTTALAVLLGIIMVNIINPGKGQKILIEKKHVDYAIEKLNDNNMNINQFAGNNNKIHDKIIQITIQNNITHHNEKNYTDELRQLLIDSGIKKNTAQTQSVKMIEYIKILRIISKLNARGLEITNQEVKKTISAIQTKTSLGDAILDLLSKLLMNPFQSLSEGNALGIIFFALLMGGIATMIGEPGKYVIQFMDGFNNIMFKLVDWVIKLAPYGVFSLTASLIGKNAGDPQKLSLLAENVGSYMLTIIIGILIHGTIILPALLYIFGKMNPIKFFMGMRSALLTAFTTCTSSGTLPLTFKATQDNLGVSKQVSDFVLPLGATVNMDGTALYEAAAVIFIANFLGIDLTITDQIIIFITATTAAIGAAAIPSAGLITMTIVLSAVGLPTSGIAIIMAVDRFLDMFRTAVNVQGDAIGSVIVSRLQNNLSNVNKESQ